MHVDPTLRGKNGIEDLTLDPREYFLTALAYNLIHVKEAYVRIGNKLSDGIERYDRFRQQAECLCPSDKRFIKGDDKMREVFKEDKVHMFAMTKLLHHHMFDPDAGTSDQKQQKPGASGARKIGPQLREEDQRR